MEVGDLGEKKKIILQFCIFYFLLMLLENWVGFYLRFQSAAVA